MSEIEDWIQYPRRFDYVSLKKWLRTRRIQLIRRFSRMTPVRIYFLFWISVFADIGSTLFMMTGGLPYQWIEANPIFYQLGTTHFFPINLLINAALFILASHHQTRWKRGAVVLFVSIFVHGICSVNNLFQLVALHAKFG